eukprot:11859589-Alexandrium_andersonii.AAC.2
MGDAEARVEDGIAVAGARLPGRPPEKDPHRSGQPVALQEAEGGDVPVHSPSSAPGPPLVPKETA